MHDGERIVKAARAAVELHLTVTNFNSKLVERHISDLDGNAAVFVSLEHYPTNITRGSAGFANAEHPMHHAVVAAAVAATQDTRYVPVSHLEFEHLVVEVSILSAMERLSGKGKGAVAKGIVIGKHGLHVEYGYHSSTFLPGFIVSNGWGAEEALDELCIAAGLGGHVWKSPGAKLFTFTTQRFREITPRGPVEEITTER